MMDTTTQGDFILAPGERYIQCPYNEAHIVTNAKLIVHLTKCRREYEKECERGGKAKEMRICNFSDNHRVYAPEIKFHEERCEDRYKVVETIRYHNSEAFTRKLDEDDRRRKERDYERRGGEKEKKHKHHDKDRDREKDRGDDHRHKDRDHHRHRDREGKDKDRNKDYREKDYNYKDRVDRGSNGGVFKDYGHGYSTPKFEDDRAPKRAKYGEDVPSKSSSNGSGGGVGNGDNIWGDAAEDWEAEAKNNYEPAYDPEERLKNDVILYQPRGLSKSERKQFRVDMKVKAETQAATRRESSDHDFVDFETGIFGRVKEEKKDYSDGWVRGNVDAMNGHYDNDVKVKYEYEPPPPAPPKIQHQYQMPMPPKVAPPKIEICIEDLEKEDGECSEEEFEAYIGEDPFSS